MSAARIVPEGGTIFIYWICTQSPDKVYRLYTSAVSNAREAKRKHISARENAELLSLGSDLFFAWMVSTLGTRFQCAKKELYSISLVLKFYGLSKTGMNLVANMGVGLPVTSFRRKLKFDMDQFAETLLYATFTV